MEVSWASTEPLYREMARKLNLDSQSEQEGVKVLQSILELGIKPDTAKKGTWVWVVCALFIAEIERGLKDGDAEASIKLTSLLQVHHLSSPLLPCYHCCYCTSWLESHNHALQSSVSVWSPID